MCRHTIWSILTLNATAALLLWSRSALASVEISVSAGARDRVGSVVTFDFPAAPQDNVGLFLHAGDERLPLQVEHDGNSTRGVFILPELNSGRTRTYWLEVLPAGPELAAPAARAMADLLDKDVLDLMVGDKEVLRYQGPKGPLPAGFGPEYQRGGYISAVHSPDGKLVTDDYPPKHKHHHGIWSPWTKTEFEGRHPDFWNMGDKTGTVEFVSLDRTFSGPVAAGFSATHRFMDLSAKPPKTALNEHWQVQTYNIPTRPECFVFDWQSTQNCASDSPLTLLEYRYGGFGFRGNRAWDGPDNLLFTNSEGNNRENGNAVRARWAYVGGKVNRKTAGVAVLCATDNFRFPQPVRIHPTEPFLSYAPEELGEFKIEPGTAYVASYRILVLDGEPDAAMRRFIEQQWQDYAEPVTVSVKQGN